MERVLWWYGVCTEVVLTYHLEVIDAGVDSGQHLLPLLGGLRTRVQRRPEPEELEVSINLTASP